MTKIKVALGARVSNGDIIFNSERHKQHQLRSKFEGKKVRVLIADEEANRSLPHNRLYFLWLEYIAEYTGHTKDDMHKFYTELFGISKLMVVGGVTKWVKKSTAEYTSAEFTEYTMKIEVHAAVKLKLQLPDPEDYWRKVWEGIALDRGLKISKG